MEENIISFTALLQVALFATTLLIGFIRHKEQLVWAYAFQSLLVAVALVELGWHEFSPVLAIIVLLTVLVKCIVTPVVLTKLMRKHKLTFTAPAHVNMPIMLCVVFVLTLSIRFAFGPLLGQMGGDVGGALYLAVSGFFVSLFFAINRKGAFSQIIGILSAENCLVAFAALMNIHANIWLELGIMADVFAWILIASTFVSIVSKHFGTIDVSTMKQLAE